MVKLTTILAAAVVLGVAGPGALAAPITVNVDGGERTALVQGTTAPGPHPVILLLHGGGGTAENIARGSGLGAVGEREGFVAVFPEGINKSWVDGREKIVNRDRKKGVVPPNDFDFVKALVAQLVASGVADPKHVYLAGFSNGGYMSLALACRDAAMFAGVAVFEANIPAVAAPNCHPATSVPFLEMSATGDPKVKFDGTTSPDGGIWPTMKTVDFFRKLDGCADQTTVEQLKAHEPNSTGTEVTRWTGCTKAPVVLYKIIGGAHRVPEAPFGANQLWAFFKDQSR
jgi:polyhydroxybutyrate depolymerase